MEGDHPGAPSPSSNLYGSPSAFHSDPSFGALHDLLLNRAASNGALGTANTDTTSTGWDGAVATPEGGGAADFNDLLAQFTLPGGAFSPPPTHGGDVSGTQGLTPGATGLAAMIAGMAGGEHGAEHAGNAMEGMTGAANGGRSAQEAMLEHLNAVIASANAASPAAAQPPPLPGAPNLAFQPQVGGPDLHAQLQQLLAQASAQANSGTPTPQAAPSQQQSPFLPAGTSTHHSPTTFAPPPAQPHSQGSSTHASPMPNYGAQSHPSPFPQYGVGSPYLPNSGTGSNGSPTTYAGPSPSMPPSFGLPPAFQNILPAAAANNPIALQAQLAAMQLLVNAQVQVQAQQQAQQQQQQQQAAQSAQAQQAQAQAAAQAQMHAHAVAAAQAQLQGQVPPHLPRDGTMTAGTSVDGSYREHDYIFSPLMSPAMTPHSAFTNASSLPPSVGPLPSGALVSPADFFPPLTSPALGPQLYPGDRLTQHRNSLQGLVDGVGALSTQLPPGSPASFFGSPRLGPQDGGSATGAGAGRRGASASKKARPSPLIKPTDAAGTLEGRRGGRRKTASNGAAVAGTDKRGTKSATSSPFLGPSGPGAHVRAASVASQSAASASSKPSPPESAPPPGASSIGSIDTPSPVDLANGGSVVPAQYTHEGLPVPTQAVPAQVFGNAYGHPPQPYHVEPMGPPPLPSSSGTSFNPVTPASFMNFASDFDMNGLSSLSPALNPVTHGPYEPTSSALSSLHNSPALLPQNEHILPALPPSSVFPTAGQLAGLEQHEQPEVDTFIAPPPPATTKAKSTRKAAAKASPALRAVDAKGKGKETGAAGKKESKKPQKIAPSPRIAPSPKIRPLLANGAGADAQARLAAKSNYENILDGHGDLLGLPASTQSQLQSAAAGSSAAPAGTADTRRSSHKVAEQKRRDSLKLCFDELRKLLPPILPYTDESDRRPGDGNVGGQRHGEVDPDNPNKGVSKVALLRRSNEYLDILRERIERRDKAIEGLRNQLGQMRQLAGLGQLAEQEEEVPGLDLDLDALDKEERAAGNLAFYEDLDFDSKVTPVMLGRKPSRRSSSASTAPTPAFSGSASEKAAPKRRSKRTAQAAALQDDMEVEGGDE